MSPSDNLWKIYRLWMTIMTAEAYFSKHRHTFFILPICDQKKKKLCICWRNKFTSSWKETSNITTCLKALANQWRKGTCSCDSKGIFHISCLPGQNLFCEYAIGTAYLYMNVRVKLQVILLSKLQEFKWRSCILVIVNDIVKYTKIHTNLFQLATIHLPCLLSLSWSCVP